MELTDFTTEDEVRAVLGMSLEEVSDDILALPMYMQRLQMELETVYTDLPSLFISLTHQATRTPEEQRVVNIVQVFSAYATSKSLLGSSTLFAPKVITDGRASVTRFDPSNDLRDDIDKTLIALRKRLLAALAALGLLPLVVQAGRSYFGVAPLYINPITGI